MKSTALLLAGGKSSRMGTNKALLTLNGKTVIEHMVQELAKSVDDIILLTNNFSDYSFLGLKMVADEWKGLGPMAGLHAGLKAAKTEYNLAVACDMPFIKSGIINEILTYLDDYDAVIPEINGKMQPLFAGYRKSCLIPIENCLIHNQLKMTSFLDNVTVKLLKIEDFSGFQQNDKSIVKSFFNMNNPEEYNEAIKWL